MNIPKKPLFSKIALIILILMSFSACKKAYTTPQQPNTGRMLQVEVKMPEPWKKIVIGPTHSIEYPKIPQRFSMFMTGEWTVALRPYMIILSKISQLSQQRPLNILVFYQRPALCMQQRMPPWRYIMFHAKIMEEIICSLNI